LYFLYILFSDPIAWKAKDIKAWLNWISKEFSLENFDAEKFPTTCFDLCRLSVDDFANLTGNVKSAQTLASFLAHFRGEPDDASTTTATTTTASTDDPSSSSSQAAKQTPYLSHDQGRTKLRFFCVL
jgi:hypothetical protein